MIRCCLLLCCLLLPGLATAFDAGSLPVLHRHRVKPLSVAAQEVVTTLGGAALKRDAAGQRRDATAAVLAILADPVAAADQPLIRVDYKPLQERLGLAERDVSLQALADPQVTAVFTSALSRDRERRLSGRVGSWDRIDDETLQLLERVHVCEALLHGEAFALMPVVRTAAQAEWALSLTLPAAAMRPWQRSLATMQQNWPQVAAHYDSPLTYFAEQAIWFDFGDLVLRPDPALSERPGDGPIIAAAAAAGQALHGAAALEPALASLADALHGAEGGLGPSYPSAAAIGRERLYQRLSPFTWTWVCYLLGGLLSAMAMMRLPGRERAQPVLLIAGVTCTLAGLIWNVVGFAFRLDISSWGAVTNLYETVVYVALVVALLGLFFALRHGSVAYAIAGALGASFCAMVGGVMPPDMGSDIGALQPVLRSRFWLWIHVKVIVASYAAFLLAWVLANGYLARAAWRRERMSAAQGLIIYRCIQVGLVLCIAGTLLGAVWADQAWGRFWGWDPKEVWALVVILTYLVPVHLRLIGAVAARGLAAWSIYGFASVIFSWYGVNMLLGAGLHSYGFGSGGQGPVLSICAVQLLLTTWQLRRIPGGAARSVSAPSTQAVPAGVGL